MNVLAWYMINIMVVIRFFMFMVVIVFCYTSPAIAEQNNTPMNQYLGRIFKGPQGLTHSDPSKVVSQGDNVDPKKSNEMLSVVKERPLQTSIIKSSEDLYKACETAIKMQDHIFLSSQCYQFIHAFLNGYVSAVQSHQMSIDDGGKVIQFNKRNNKVTPCDINVDLNSYSKRLAFMFVKLVKGNLSAKTSQADASLDGNTFNYLTTLTDRFLCSTDR